MTVAVFRMWLRSTAADALQDALFKHLAQGEQNGDGFLHYFVGNPELVQSVFKAVFKRETTPRG